GLRRLSLYRHLILPASLPAFVAGLKQGWAFAWRSLMAGELLVIIANQPSLGVLLSTDQDQSDMPSATAIIIVILFLGILVHGLFSMADGAIRRRWGLTGSSWRDLVAAAMQYGSVLVVPESLVRLRRSSAQRPRICSTAGTASRNAGAASRASVAAAGLHPELISAEPNIPDVPKLPADSIAS